MDPTDRTVSKGASSCLGTRTFNSLAGRIRSSYDLHAADEGSHRCIWTAAKVDALPQH